MVPVAMKRLVRGRLISSCLSSVGAASPAQSSRRSFLSASVHKRHHPSLQSPSRPRARSYSINVNAPRQGLVSSRPISSTSTRLFSSNDTTDKKEALLQGLDIHTIPAEDDGHPMAVYTINKDDKNTEQQKRQRTPVLLLHGRTWSSVPVYHLVGGGPQQQQSRSLIEALYNTNQIQPYAMDFRGFGGTPKDDSGFVEPLRCVKDVVSVMNWIHELHSGERVEGDDGSEVNDGGVARPALLGWSHGALIAQIVAQRHQDVMSKLIL